MADVIEMAEEVVGRQALLRRLGEIALYAYIAFMLGYWLGEEIGRHQARAKITKALDGI